MVTKKRPRHRGNNEGSIYQEPSGRWKVQISRPGDSRVKRRRKWLSGKTRQEVIEKRNEYLASILNGSSEAASDQTVEQATNVWLERTRSSLRYTTWMNYESVLRNHVTARLGKMKLTSLSSKDVDRLYEDLLAEGRAPATVAKVHRTLHTMLEYHRKRENVIKNVASLVSPPRVVQREKMMLSPEAARKFLEVIKNHRLEAMIVLAITTGARSGELRGLIWDRVDLKQGTIRIDKSMQMTESGHELGDTKTRGSRRTVALSRRATEALVRHRHRQQREAAVIPQWRNTHNLVFTTTAGTRLDAKNVLNRVLRPLLHKAVLPATLRFHDLRDIAASLALTKRPVTEVAAMLGHSHPGTTLRVNAHALPGSGEHVAAAMDDLLATS